MNERRCSGRGGDAPTELPPYDEFDDDCCQQLHRHQHHRPTMSDSFVDDDYCTTRVVVDEDEPEIGRYTPRQTAGLRHLRSFPLDFQ